ncbi:hypothetical protein NDU88_002468 [Pleurodeles waltl]|uniref:Uncharacterized protein n=1 Tax=Pleurodeles waltl TaxID=8319 RepID=A0AAV7TKR6_PLEWA|nr:hypothetical protein NDU88_002468 [Pleurodeles waltl]
MPYEEHTRQSVLSGARERGSSCRESRAQLDAAARDAPDPTEREGHCQPLYGENSLPAGVEGRRACRVAGEKEAESHLQTKIKGCRLVHCETRLQKKMSGSMRLHGGTEGHRPPFTKKSHTPSVVCR